MNNKEYFLEYIIRCYSYHSILNCVRLSDVVYKFVNFKWLRQKMFREMYVNEQ